MSNEWKAVSEEWISVEDELPKMGEMVLIADGEEVYPYTAGREFIGANWEWNNGYEEGIVEKWLVTHWMPLPDSPKSE